jgi:amino acid transporter
MGSLTKLKHFLFGKPIHSKRAQHERLIIVFALAVFASDALSSSAYATEEILHKLQDVAIGGGAWALGYLLPITFALIALLWIVIFSYYQTIQAYPTGGGSYRVSSENLGRVWGLIAAGALLIGYVLTVAVSVSAGASAIVSMLPQTQPYAALMASVAVAVITFFNLRGAKESGAVFAIPTYSYVVLVLGLILWGAFSMMSGGSITPVVDHHTIAEGIKPIGTMALAFFIFKAFAAGCTALTGTEAIADGVLAFEAPEHKNASKTLVWMGIVLMFLVVGISWAATNFGITAMSGGGHGAGGEGYMTVLAQIAAAIFGSATHPGFYITQVATALILVLAANTGFADFPRLSMFVAKDGFLPRQLTTVGDRLVFQNGIITLAVLSILLIIGFNADPHLLIPMYAVGVFLSFTLSQLGMVFWFRKNQRGSWKAWVSGLGSFVCAVVTLLLLFTRFTEGAWIAIAALIIIVMIFFGIKRHYNWLDKRLSIEDEPALTEVDTTVILLVPRLHKGILQAISYSKALTDDTRAIHVTLGRDHTGTIKKEWQAFGEDIPLVILESPYRSLIRPIIDYIDETLREHEGDKDHMVTVIVPQAVPKTWLQRFLHSNIAFSLKLALRSKPNVVVTNVRYFL